MRTDQTPTMVNHKPQTSNNSINTDSSIQIDEHTTRIAAATRIQNKVKQPYIWGDEDDDTPEDEEIADYRFRQELLKKMAPKDHGNSEQTTIRKGNKTSPTIPSSSIVRQPAESDYQQTSSESEEAEIQSNEKKVRQKLNTRINIPIRQNKKMPEKRGVSEK